MIAPLFALVALLPLAIGTPPPSATSAARSTMMRPALVQISTVARSAAPLSLLFLSKRQAGLALHLLRTLLVDSQDPSAILSSICLILSIFIAFLATLALVSNVSASLCI